MSKYPLILFLIFLRFSLFFLPSYGQAQSKQDDLQKLRAIETGKLNVNDSVKINLLVKLAQEYANQKPDSAITLSKRVLELSDIDSIQLIAYKTIAKSYYVLSNPALMYDYSQEVIRIAQRLEDFNSVLFGQGYLGLAFLIQEEYRESITVFDQYLIQANRLKDSIGIIKGNLNLSINYNYLNEYDTALMFVNRSIEVSILADKGYYLAMGYNRKGYILHDLYRFREAIENHNLALQTMSDDNDWERSFSYAGLAQSYVGLKEYNESIEYGLKGLSMARDVGAKWDIRNAARIISESYSEAGDFQKAYEYYKIYKSYNDSIFTEENEKKVFALKLRAAEVERDALKVENSLQSKILDQRDFQLFLLAIIAIILLAMILILDYYNKRRRSYMREIAQKRDELHDLNQSKDKILSVLAHDLRGSIASIKGLLYLMKSPGNKEKVEELAEEAYDHTNKVHKNLNGILDWAKQQFKETEVISVEFKIRDIVEEQIGLIRYDANRKEINLIHEESGPFQVKADIEHVRIIIRNLFSNALKYSNQGGTVTISYQDLLSQIIICVEDDGVGMSAEIMNDVFEPKSISRPGTNKELGSGIGLFLCKEYASKNGGKLKVQTKEGEGCTFKLVLNKPDRP